MVGNDGPRLAFAAVKSYFTEGFIISDDGRAIDFGPSFAGIDRHS